MRFVVTGAARGIGLELVRQILALGNEADAVVRDPARATELSALGVNAGSRLRLVQGDVSDDASAARIGNLLAPGPVDVLVNNAGVLGTMGALSDVTSRELLDVYSTNAIGPLRVTRAVLPRLREGQGKRILNVSTGMGSISDNGSGGAWAYRMSKAALNMATKNLSLELRRDGIACVAVNPGWVQTDMGGKSATTTVETSARNLLAIIGAMSLDNSGAFLNYDGKRYDW